MSRLVETTYRETLCKQPTNTPEGIAEIKKILKEIGYSKAERVKILREIRNGKI